MKKVFALILLFVFTCTVTVSAQDEWTSPYDTVRLNNNGLTFGDAREFIANKEYSHKEKNELVKTIANPLVIPGHLFIENILSPLLQEAKKEEDNRTIMAYYSDISFIYTCHGELEKAAHYIDSASFYEPYVTDTRTLAKYNRDRGYSLAHFRSYYDTEVRHYFFKSIHYFEQLEGYENQILMMLYNMCLGYAIMGDTWSLNETIQKMESLSLKNAEVDFLLNTLYTARYKIDYMETEDQNYLDSIISYSRENLSIYENTLLHQVNSVFVMDNSNLALCYVAIAYAESQKNEDIDYTLIREMINQAESLKSTDPIVSMDIALIETKLLLDQKLYDEALNRLSETMEYIRSAPDTRESLNKSSFQIKSYELLSKIYEAKKEYKKALEYEVKRIELYAEINKANKYNIIKDLEYRYEANKKEQQITHLTEQQTYQRRIQALYVGIILLLAVLIIVLTLWHRNRQKESQQRVTALRQRIVRSKYIPHFTGNVLNSINYLIEKDPHLAQEYVSEFASFNRSSMLNAEKLSLPLSEELQFTEQYLKLEKLRYEDKLEYTIAVDPSISPSSITVPVMALHTFCENAIKHGIRHKEGTGHIKIEIYQEDDGIVMAVEDDGIGRAAAREMNTNGTGEGLSIIDHQINFFNRNNKKKACLRITDLITEQNVACGTRFEFYIPTSYSVNV